MLLVFNTIICVLTLIIVIKTYDNDADLIEALNKNTLSHMELRKEIAKWKTKKNV